MNQPRDAKTAGVVAWIVVTAGTLGCGATPAATADSPDRSERTNVVWIVAEDGGDLEPVRSRLGSGASAVARLVVDDMAGPGLRAALLTGVAAGLLTPPPPSATPLPLRLRHAGYYTSRAGAARDDLAMPRPSAALGDLPGLRQPGLLGAWDAAGPAADWRGREKDWEYPCTVAFGCGSTAVSGEKPFFSLFNLEHGADVAAASGEIMDRLDADGLTDSTAVIVVALGPGEGYVVGRWPRDAAFELTESGVHVLDLVPSVLALAGVSASSAGSGVAILPSTAAADEAPRVAATPSSYPNGGVYHVAPVVTLSCETPDATIVYTTEREGPFYWRLYRGPFRMRFWELRAQCGRLGYRDSDIALFEFDIE